MSRTHRRWLTLFAVITVIVLVFVMRTILARDGTPPRLFDLFDTFIALASLVVVMVGWRTMSRIDWMVGLGAGLLVGVLLPFSTLYNPYLLSCRDKRNASSI